VRCGEGGRKRCLLPSENCGRGEGKREDFGIGNIDTVRHHCPRGKSLSYLFGEREEKKGNIQEERERRLFSENYLSPEVWEGKGEL